MATHHHGRVCLNYDSVDEYLHAIKARSVGVDLVMCVLLSARGSTYNLIKTHLCCENPSGCCMVVHAWMDAWLDAWVDAWVDW